MTHGLTLTETLLRTKGADALTILADSWEVGRLVLAPEYRHGQNILKRCLFLALRYSLKNVKAQNLFAACTDVLGRLYRRFGFSVIEKNVPLQGTEKTYTLIYGHASHVLTTLEVKTEDIDFHRAMTTHPSVII
jgi:hypothetical protein